MLALAARSMRIVFKKQLDLQAGEHVVEQIHVGEIRDVRTDVGLFLIAAGWARSETRVAPRRSHGWPRPLIDRRRQGERRLMHE
jgi:hypothetical protein